MKKKSIFIGLVLAFSSFFLQAQELINKELSLNDAIKMAMENHQQLKISQANLEVSEQQVIVRNVGNNIAGSVYAQSQRR